MGTYRKMGKNLMLPEQNTGCCTVWDRRITTGKYKDWRRDKKKIRTEMVQEDENGYSE